jgi:hypothetical protein
VCNGDLASAFAPTVWPTTHHFGDGLMRRSWGAVGESLYTHPSVVVEHTSMAAVAAIDARSATALLDEMQVSEHTRDVDAGTHSSSDSFTRVSALASMPVIAAICCSARNCCCCPSPSLGGGRGRASMTTARQLAHTVPGAAVRRSCQAQLSGAAVRRRSHLSGVST